MIAEQLLRIISGLFVGIWVARYLGPNQFGLLTYVLAYTSFFACIANLGLGDIVVREIINVPDKRDTYLGTAFWLKATSALVSIILIVAIALVTGNNSPANLFIFITAGGLLFQSFDVVEFYFQSQVMARIVSICKVAQLALSSAIKIYLLLIKADLIFFIVASVFDAFSLAVSYFIAYKISQKSSFCKQFDLTVAKHLLKNSWPLMFSGLFIILYMKIDQVMIGKMLGDQEVGIYTVGTRLVEFLMFLPTVIVTSLFPAILSSKQKGIVIYKARIHYLFSMVIYMSLPFSVCFYFLSSLIINLTFGEQYRSSSDVLSFYSFALPFMFLAIASSRCYVAEKLQRLLFFRAMFGALVNIILNITLIPYFGIIGAAFATIASYVFIAFIFDFLNSKTTHFGLMKIKSLIPPFMVTP